MNTSYNDLQKKFDSMNEENVSLKSKLEFMNQKVNNLERENAKLYK